MDKPKDVEGKEDGYDEAWKAELHRRLEDLKNGKGQLVSSEVVVEELRRRLSKSKLRNEF